MILYFDSYITDIPLHNDFQKLRKIENKIKNGCTNYQFQSRLDIAKYTLASYSSLNWSNVVIKYELEDSSLNDGFDNFIYDLFPDAIIIHNRSDSQQEYAKSIKLLESLNDEWIFYAPNNDHVFINNKDVFEPLIKKANSLKHTNNNNISILYSHFSESICAIKPGHLVNHRDNNQSNLIDEDEFCYAHIFPKGNLDSIQILHLDLMKKWFLEKDLGSTRVIRAESLISHITPPSQIVITPKQEIIRHYDGYMHTIYGGKLLYLSPDKVTPLFIPKGFFTKKIKIAYGYSEYREGWVNINPCNEKYSFRDNISGTDIKCSIDEIPLFWKDRICEIDINKKADLSLLKKLSQKNLDMLSDPWKSIPKFKSDIYNYFQWYRTIIYVIKKYYKNIFGK